MIPETPALREDGRCLTCLGPRVVIPKVLVKRTAHDLRAALELDPFCSTECARAYYGTSLPVVSTGNRTNAAPKAKRVAAPLVHGTERTYVNDECRCDECREAANEARRQRRKKARA